jgi:hypothetical protein
MREEMNKINKIKMLLQVEFPYSKLRFKYCSSKNHMDSSDCIKIFCDDPTDVKKVIAFLEKNTLGIAINSKEKAFEDAIGIRQITSQILWNLEWIDFGTVKFIDVN